MGWPNDSVSFRAAVSFHDGDYAGGGAESLRAQIEQHLAAAGIDLDGGPIRLLTMPRILGFVFNPLNVYFCHERTGVLRTILYEVNNTFGERHVYLLQVEGDAPLIRQSIAKTLHVSPFMGMDMRYDFQVTPPSARLSIGITVSDANGTIMTAVHTAKRRALTDAALARIFLTHPLLTLKVAAGILWEAAKLWAKGVPVHSKPNAPRTQVTIGSERRKIACT
jgi:DUF1365 family protein